MRKFFLLFVIVVCFVFCKSAVAFTYTHNNLVYEYEGTWDLSPLTLVGCTDTTVVSITVPSYVYGHPVSYVGYSRENSFEKCPNLESITLPSGIIAILDAAFNECKSLKEFTIPKSTRYISEVSFWHCDSLATFNVEEGNEYFTTDDGVLFNKSHTTITKYPSGRKRTSYSIPDDVELINKSAFYSNRYLEQVIIPNSVTEIGYGAFSHCTALINLEIPNSVEKIGAYTFERCDSLKKILIPSSVTVCEGAMFSGNTALESITVEADIESFYETLWGFTSLKEVIITSPKIKKVSLNFSRSPELRLLKLSDSITNLDLILSGCPKLESLNLPANLITFDYGTPGEALKEFNIDSNNQFFSTIDGVLYSKDLTELLFYPPNNSKVYVIPDHVVTIGDRAFSMNYRIKEIRRNKLDCQTDSAIILGNSLRSIGYSAFSSCINLHDVDLPSTIQHIGTMAFWNTESLGEIELPICLETLGHNCFEKSKINSLQLPPMINEIFDYGCDTLYVSSRKPEPNLSGNAESFERTVLYVPQGYKAIYLSTEGWNLAKEIKETEYTWTDDIVLEENQYFIDIDVPLKLSGTIIPDNASFKFILWRCDSDPENYKLNEFTGEFVGLKRGIYKIFAYPIDGGDVKAETTVIVGYSKPTEIIFSKETYNLTVGWSTIPEITILPENSYYTEIEWSSSESDIAEVVDGKVTAKGIGKAIITATLKEYGIHAECTVNVLPEYVKSIILSASEWDAVEGETLTLSATVRPEDATDKSVTWSSSDTSVATVSEDGVVSALKPGEAVITATAADGSGVTASCNVYVTAKLIPVESLTLDPSEWSGEEGESFQITPLLMPENASEKTLEWSSSNEMVATVDNTGMVSVLSQGSCVITAKTTDGSDLSAECIITSTAGLDDILADDMTFDVYSIQGALIDTDCTRHDLKKLSSGIYILRSGNKSSKIIIR